MAYLFDPDRGGTNSILLASIGVVSAILMPLVIRRRYIERKALGPSALTLMVVGLIVLLNVVIMLGLGWGQWDDPLVSRFTLPFWFLLAWATTYVVFESTGSARIKIARFVCVLSLLYVVVFAIADASASRATNKLKPAFLLARSLEYIKQYDPWRQTLIIAGSALPYLNEGYPATTFSKKADLAPVVNFKLYENILVVLHYKRNASNGAWMGDITMKQFEGAVFETLKEFQLDPFNRIVISRLKSMPREKMAEWIPSTEDEDPASYGRRIYMMLP